MYKQRKALQSIACRTTSRTPQVIAAADATPKHVVSATQ
jgi:hypothetical protein